MACKKGFCGHVDCAAVHDAVPITGAVCDSGHAVTVTCRVWALVGFQTVVQYTFMLNAWVGPVPQQ